MKKICKTDKLQPSELLCAFKEVESWTVEKKNEYYGFLRKYCDTRKMKSISCSWLIAKISPMLRKFSLEIRGAENAVQDTTAVYVGNHSNSHDTFVVKEVFGRMGKPVTYLAAWDGLNILSRIVFYLGNATFIIRTEKKSIEKGFLQFCSKILNGTSGFIFGEATWNLHPILPMQKIKAGVIQAALITGKPIIPVIIEYVEVPRICKKERELFSKCIVSFGKPIYVTTERNIFEQTEEIQYIMESMRRELWEECGIVKTKIEDIDEQIYMNHLYLKKFKALGFKYNSMHETKFLLNKENEYCVDLNGNFVPGILQE